MTAIRHSLQRDLFAHQDERLLSCINVGDPKKKKKTYFLCLCGSFMLFLCFFYVHFTEVCARFRYESAVCEPFTGFCVAVTTEKLPFDLLKEDLI
jgi:hypothetical protein